MNLENIISILADVVAILLATKNGIPLLSLLKKTFF